MRHYIFLHVQQGQMPGQPKCLTNFRLHIRANWMHKKWWKEPAASGKSPWWTGWKIACHGNNG